MENKTCISLKQGFEWFELEGKVNLIWFIQDPGSKYQQTLCIAIVK